MDRNESDRGKLEHLAQVLPAAIRPKSELVRALERDHEDLRSLASVLKGEKPLPVKRTAYKRFTALLKSHSVAEEKAVYDMCLKHKSLRTDTFEGYTEHQVCDDLMRRIQGIRQPEKWQGAVKVLAELVEHHVNEEERTLFPELERAIPYPERLQAEARFLEIRDETQDYARDAGVITDLGA